MIFWIVVMFFAGLVIGAVCVRARDQAVKRSGEADGAEAAFEARCAVNGARDRLMEADVYLAGGRSGKPDLASAQQCIREAREFLHAARREERRRRRLAGAAP